MRYWVSLGLLLSSVSVGWAQQAPAPSVSPPPYAELNQRLQQVRWGLDDLTKALQHELQQKEQQVQQLQQQVQQLQQSGTAQPPAEAAAPAPATGK